MLRKLAFVLTLTGIAVAQTAPAAKPAPKAPAAKKPGASAPANAGGSAIVMYVPGLCNLQGPPPVPAQPVTKLPPGGTPDEKPQCFRTVTKDEFEMLVKRLGPQAERAPKEKIAEYYARALALENEGRKRGLTNQKDVQFAIWMGRVQALSEALQDQLHQEYGNVPDSEVTAYYDAHKQDFDEATIKRVVIPKPQKPAEAAKTEEKPGAPAAPSTAKPTQNLEPAYEQQVTARKALAEQLLARAKAGDDLNKLQKEAFEAAKIQEAPAEAEGATIHRGQLPPTHDEKVFATKDGQFTDLIEEPSAYMFYKVEKRRVQPESEVAGEIKREIENQKKDVVVRKMFDSVKPILNPAFFQPSATQKPGAKPEAQPGEAPQGEAPQAQPPQQEAPKAEQPEAPKTPQPEQAAPKQENPSEPPK